MITHVALQKTSLIDFPGAVAAVVFTDGCNFRCPYCHNPELALGKGSNDLTQVGELLGFFEKRKELLSGIVFSGGEPLIHDDLPRLAVAAKKRGYKIKLDTNGSFPDRIAEIGADYIAIDLKTAPALYERVAPRLPDAGEKVMESIKIVRKLGIPYEIRITCAPGIVGPQEMSDIADLLEVSDTIVLQEFRPIKTLDIAWTRINPYSQRIMEDLLEVVKRRAPASRIRGRYTST